MRQWSILRKDSYFTERKKRAKSVSGRGRKRCFRLCSVLSNSPVAINNPYHPPTPSKKTFQVRCEDLWNKSLRNFQRTGRPGRPGKPGIPSLPGVPVSPGRPWGPGSPCFPGIPNLVLKVDSPFFPLGPIGPWGPNKPWKRDKREWSGDTDLIEFWHLA